MALKRFCILAALTLAAFLSVASAGAVGARRAYAHSALPAPPVAQAQAAAWTVSVLIHELDDIANNDAYDAYDFYYDIRLTVEDAGQSVHCRNFAHHSEDIYHLRPDPPWGCSIDVEGDDPRVEGVIAIWDHDIPSEDDHLDVHPAPDFNNIRLDFRPATHRLNLLGIDDNGAGGVDEADANGDGVVDVDLPALGADPYRRDLFVELDWMVDSLDAGFPPHSHEPWLPALVNAWHELDQAPLSGPLPPDGVARREGNL